MISSFVNDKRTTILERHHVDTHRQLNRVFPVVHGRQGHCQSRQEEQAKEKHPSLKERLIFYCRLSLSQQDKALTSIHYQTFRCHSHWPISGAFRLQAVRCVLERQRFRRLPSSVNPLQLHVNRREAFSSRCSFLKVQLQLLGAEIENMSTA